MQSGGQILLPPFKQIKLEKSVLGELDFFTSTKDTGFESDTWRAVSQVLAEKLKGNFLTYEMSLPIFSL
jgi:hypothetical protein